MSEDDSNYSAVILKSIFTSIDTKLLPIIKTSEQLHSIIEYFSKDQIPINIKFKLISFLTSLFQENKILIPYFVTKCKTDNLNLLESIINIYFIENIENELKKTIEHLLLLIVENISATSPIFEFIYQKLSVYFIDENMSKINEQYLLKALRLLQIFYKEISQPLPNEETEKNKDDNKENEKYIIINNNKNEKKEEIKDINNYIYFNGKDSFLSLELNKNSINVNSNFPTLENGCSVFFWVYMDKELTNHYFTLFQYLKIYLIKLKIDGHQIKLLFKNPYNFNIEIDETTLNDIDITNKFVYNNWNNICFIMEKKGKINYFKIIINGYEFSYPVPLPKSLLLNKPLESIILFDNFFGRVSTILFFSFNINMQMTSYFRTNFKYGFHKNKYLFKFLSANDDDYFANSPEYSYLQKYKNAKGNSNKLFKIKLKEHNIKYLISCFVPFTYDKSNNVIDDIFGNFIGVFGNNDGVNNYINYSNALNFLGGIDNLLPIAEMMYLNKDILNENTFYEYFLIIDEIFIEHTKNLMEANKNKFFSNLGLFLEKYPSNIFTSKILNIFLKIGKESFQLFDDKYSSTDNFVNMILLNEKIFSKFSPENQSKLWEGVYQFFVSDYSQIRESLNISKICLLLRFYDEKRYEEYCCKRHSDLFNVTISNSNQNESGLKVMNPEMNYKIDKLFDIIQLYINNFSQEKDIVNLYKLLSLDLSPCLQKKIVQVYINYFSIKNMKDKNIVLENLLNNNFLEISEYVLSISLLDVRIEILKLINLLFGSYLSIIKTYIGNTNTNNSINNIVNNANSININTNNNNNIITINNLLTNSTIKNASISIQTIYMFIQENLLPERLMVEIDNNINDKKDNINNNNKSIKKSFPLINYSNKKIYEEDLCCLWTILDTWFASKENPTGGKKAKPNIKLNEYALNFCINFVSSEVPAYCMDIFIRSLNSYINDKNILNPDVIYESKNLFPWLIESLFYYYSKEHTEKIESKDLVENIQKSLLKLYKEFFVNKKIKEDFKYKINYVFEYSYYMKKLFQNDLKKVDEISRITRLLLEKIMEYSLDNDDINKKSQICFDFIFLYKNNEENLYILYNDGYNTNLGMYMGQKNKKNKLDIDNLDDLNQDNKKKNESIDKFEKFKSNLKKNNDLIPDYIYDGLFFNEELIKTKATSLLKEMWKDFILYDNIIDSYRSNIWGIENICKIAKIEYDGNFLNVCQKLVKSYSESKKCKNILTNDILKCLGIVKKNNANNTISTAKTLKTTKVNVHSSGKIVTSPTNDDKNDNLKVNVLKTNLILLCVAIDITRDKGEKDFYEGYFQQFLIYCVIASCNVSSSDKNHNKIQNILYDILLFGFTFFQKRNKEKYDKLFDSLIKPIFDESSTEHNKKGFKGLFNKKNLLKNSAILKLFVPEDFYKEKEKEDINFDEIEQEDELNSTFMAGFGYATDRRNVFRRGISNDIMYKDDTTIDKKKKKVKYILRKEDLKMISGKIFDTIITDYKNKRNKERFNNSIKIFYRNIHPYTIEQKYADERIRINNIIRELIPFFETYIKKYSNTYYLEEKKRRNEYKRCKKHLFSWRGFWSNRFLFFEHPELLKLKKKNHFTKEMIQPLLTPVLDIDYYLPNFKKFDKSKLFNNNNYYYRINLDIDELLKEEIKEKEDKKKRTIYKRNQFGFNYLECLYKLSYIGLWEQYQYYHENSFNFEKIIQKENNNNYNYNILLPTSSFTSTKDSNLSIQEKEKDKDKEKEEKKEKKNLPTENTYHCCIVKLTHHIKGFLSTEERCISFIYNNNINLSEEKDDPNFDIDMGSCFGSIFKNHKKDKDKIDFTIDYINIKYMFVRHYFYNESAIEIYTETNKSYFFNFRNNKELSQFIYDVLHHSFFREIKTEDYKGKKILGYESMPFTTKKKSYSINHKAEDWQNYNISTLEYLMWLNIYSGRSFNDLTQYPVFPWIIKNYQSEVLNMNNDQRNLDLPMGMMGTSEKSIIRKETFIDFYNTLKNDLIEANPGFNYQEFLKKGDEYYDYYKYKKSKREKTLSMAMPEDNQNLGPSDSCISSLQINQIPYFFGTHYSNPTYISNYLSRTFPFSFISIEIQGEKFDDPDRMFLSMKKTFESASSLKDDVRELIPEFYILPEMFLNINNLNLSQDKVDSEGKQIIINNVDLPPWSQNKSTKFVAEMRKNLENSELKINKWIDLIFGHLQRGPGAEENNNIFMAHTYERMVKIDNIEDSDSRNALMRLVEIGVTPFQLFDNESKQKVDKNIIITKNNIYSYSKDSFLEESSSINSSKITSTKYNSINNNIYQNHKYTSNKEIKQEIFQKIAKIIWLSPNNLKIITNTNYYYNLKYNMAGEIKIEEESNSIEIENNSNKFAPSYLVSSIKTPIILYNNNKYMIKGGFWDGRLEISTLVNAPKEEPYNTCLFPNCGPITTMVMSKNEQMLICGTKLGVILVFQVYDKNIIMKHKLFLYTDEITSIAINDNLNMFISASKDGYIMLNTLPTMELIRSLKIKINKNKNNITNLYASNVFLSSSPIPVIVIYCSEAKLFKIYSINGLNIGEQEEVDYTVNIKCYCIYNNLDFQEFLIYGTDDGLVKIRQFPNMDLLNSISPFDGEPIETLTMSQDKRYCYVWSKENQIGLIKDCSSNNDDKKEDNFGRLGYIQK